MNISQYVDPKRCLQLVTGVVGIYFSYLVTGILHESMLKHPYKNDVTGADEKFTWAAGFLIFPCGITWIIGEIVNHFTIKKQERIDIPAKNAALCGLTVAISTLTYTYAIYLTNFPVVMMFKSCNLISVVMVGVCCSRVRDDKLKLGVKKIVIGVLVTLGIVLFKAADPNLKQSEQKTQILGIVLLIVSLMADGFLPDFQAEIKSVYKPQPMEMLTVINKWVTIISLLYSFMLLEAFDMITYIATHSGFLVHLLAMGVLSTIGQMFVYRMIKQFKQHFVPFVITTRKIFTVALSIIFYHHPTNLLQIAGIVMVFVIVTYEFVSELMGEKHENHQAQQSSTSDLAHNRPIDLVEVQPEPVSHEEPREEGNAEQKEGEIYKKRLVGEHAQEIIVARPKLDQQ